MTDGTSAAPAPAGAGEERELLDLHANDPQIFEHAPWRDSGRTGAERLLDLRKAGGDSGESVDKIDPEQAEDDDLADADVTDIDLDAPVEDAEGADEESAEAEEGERASPWPERPDSLKDATPEEVDAWKEKAGLATRDEYELPELDDGHEFTDYGRSLSEKITQLGYDLDLSPDQTKQLIVRGDPILKALAEARDIEDKKAGSQALLDEFNGDRDAAKAHVAEARVALKGLPDGLGKLLLDARGPDGRRLGFNPSFLRWAAQIGADGRSSINQQPQDRTAMLQAELAAIDEAMHQDVANLYKPWKGTGKLATDRKLEILRQLDNPDPNPRQTRANLEAEKRELVALRQRDEQLFAYGNWRGSGRPAADRLAAIQAGRG